MIRTTRALAGCASLLGAALLVTPEAAAAICDGISPAASSPLTSVRITTGLTRPTDLTAPREDTRRIFVLEQPGRIRIIKDGVLLAAPFLDVTTITQSTGNEEGLLGLAFSPQYESDGLFFIYHTDLGGGSNSVARYRVSADPDIADSTSRKVILSIPHPSFSNHNGGGIQFARDDGYLYVGPGDGGSSCDPSDNAQNTNELKGKMLRIDVIPPPAVDPPYRIPPNNPGFTKPEIFSLGLRNPWRFSFDRLTHDLYIGDVGQNNWEEVNWAPAANKGRGGNYGWKRYEGLACPPPACGGACNPLNPRIDPVKVYSLAGTPCSVTGGYVYRGCRMPDLANQGRYFYADYCQANIESFVISGGAATNERTHTLELVPIGGFSINLITSFGEDAQGELYILDRGSGTGTGEVFKIVPVLRNLETSGPGATAFRLSPGSWTWEDLALSSSHPINLYRVYRHAGNGSGTFQCVFATPSATPPARPPTVWVGGDAANPLPGEVFSYIVTAVRSSPFEETSPGRRSDGALRVLGSSICP